MSVPHQVWGFLGKRKRSIDDKSEGHATASRIKTTDVRNKTAAPRRRSLRQMQQVPKEHREPIEDARPIPGAFPGTDDYSLAHTLKTTAQKSKPQARFIIAEERTEGFLNDTKKTRTRTLKAPTSTSDEEDLSEPKSTRPLSVREAARYSTRDTLAGLELRQRRKSFQIHPYGGTLLQALTETDERLSEPLPLTSPGFTTVLESNSSASEPQTADIDADVLESNARTELLEKAVLQLAQVAKKNYPHTRQQSYIREEVQRQLETINETYSESHGSRGTSPSNSKSETKKGTASPPRRSNSLAGKHANSIPSSSSREELDELRYPSLGGSRSSSPSRHSQTSAASTVSLEDTLLKLSEAIHLQSQKHQELITRLATKAPSSTPIPRIEINEGELSQAINTRVLEALQEFREQPKHFWMPQGEAAHKLHRSTAPMGNYFAKNGGMRKNYLPISVEKARAILEAHEVGYRYRRDECMFQKLLKAHTAYAAQMPSLYSSMRNSVVDMRMEDYPHHDTYPFHPKTGQRLTWQQCCGIDPVILTTMNDRAYNPIRDNWNGLGEFLAASRVVSNAASGATSQASSDADLEAKRRASGPMVGVEITGEAQMNTAWNIHQGIRFGNGLSSTTAEAQGRDMPCKNRLQGRDCVLGEYCPWSHAPEIILRAQNLPRDTLNKEWEYLWASVSEVSSWSWQTLNTDDRYQQLVQFLRERANTIEACLNDCSQDNVKHSMFNDANTLELDIFLKQWWANFCKSPLPSDLGESIGLLKKTMVQASKMIEGKWHASGGNGNYNPSGKPGGGSGGHQSKNYGKSGNEKTNRHGNARGQNDWNNASNHMQVESAGDRSSFNARKQITEADLDQLDILLQSQNRPLGSLAEQQDFQEDSVQEKKDHERGLGRGNGRRGGRGRDRGGGGRVHARGGNRPVSLDRHNLQKRGGQAASNAFSGSHDAGVHSNHATATISGRGGPKAARRGNPPSDVRGRGGPYGSNPRGGRQREAHKKDAQSKSRKNLQRSPAPGVLNVLPKNVRFDDGNL